MTHRRFRSSSPSSPWPRSAADRPPAADSPTVQTRSSAAARSARTRSSSSRWRSGSVPVGTHRHGHQGRRGRRQRHVPPSRAATFVYDSRGPNLIGYGTWRDVWRQRDRLLHADGAHQSSRCGCENRATCSTGARSSGARPTRRRPNGCYDAETVALDEFGHVEILDHHVNQDDQSDYTDAVVQTFSRTKPGVGWNMHVARRLRRREPPAQVRHDVVDGEVLDLRDPGAPRSPCPLRASLAYGGQGHDRRDAQGHGPDRLRPARGQSRLRADRHAPDAGAGDHDVDRSGHDVPRQHIRDVHPDPHPHGDIQVRAVFKTPTDEGLNGDTSPTATIDVGPCRTLCPSSLERDR